MTVLIDTDAKTFIDFFTRIKSGVQENIRGVLMTRVEKSAPLVAKRYWLTANDPIDFSSLMRQMLRPVISSMFDRPFYSSEVIELINPETNQEEIFFLENIVSKPSLVIAGAGHIGRTLSVLGKMLGFQVTIWDDREEMLENDELSADVILNGTIESAVDKLRTNDNSYLVIVTRGHKNDAEVLRKFLSLPKAYLGMIGSKAKIAQMKEVFLKNNWATEAEWAKIYTPIGLNIGAKTVEEIAVSIASQLIQVKNERGHQ